MVRGSCLCGAVRFEITGETTKIGMCHCSKCRKVSGAASNPLIDSLLRRGNVTIGAPNPPDLYPPQQPVKTGTAAKLLDAERAER